MAGKDAIDITIEIDQVIKRWKKYIKPSISNTCKGKTLLGN